MSLRGHVHGREGNGTVHAVPAHDQFSGPKSFGNRSPPPSPAELLPQSLIWPLVPWLFHLADAPSAVDYSLSLPSRANAHLRHEPFHPPLCPCCITQTGSWHYFSTLLPFCRTQWCPPQGASAIPRLSSRLRFAPICWTITRLCNRWSPIHTMKPANSLRWPTVASTSSMQLVLVGASA